MQSNAVLPAAGGADPTSDNIQCASEQSDHDRGDKRKRDIRGDYAQPVLERHGKSPGQGRTPHWRINHSSRRTRVKDSVIVHPAATPKQMVNNE
jgi:hypothetical protein